MGKSEKKKNGNESSKKKKIQWKKKDLCNKKIKNKDFICLELV